MKFKVSETVAHNVALVGFFIALLIAIYTGEALAERSEFFAELWDSTYDKAFTVALFVGILFFLPMYTYSYFFGDKKFIRSFKNLNRSKLEFCKDNELVRIQGKLVPFGEQIVAPFSKKVCSAYETTAFAKEEVATYNDDIDTKYIWATIKSVANITDLLIQCDDYYALVRTDECDFKIHSEFIHDEGSYSWTDKGFLSEKENNIRTRTLDNMNVSARNYVGTYAEDVKFEEGILEENEQVAVCGVGQWVDTVNNDNLKFLYDKGVKQVFEIKKCEGNQVYVSDTLDVLDKKRRYSTYTKKWY